MALRFAVAAMSLEFGSTNRLGRAAGVRRWRDPDADGLEDARNVSLGEERSEPLGEFRMPRGAVVALPVDAACPVEEVPISCMHDAVLVCCMCQLGWCMINMSITSDHGYRMCPNKECRHSGGRHGLETWESS